MTVFILKFHHFLCSLKNSLTSYATTIGHFLLQFFFLKGTEINQHIAYEWLEEKEDERAVVVRIKPRCEIEVDSCTGRRLRTVKLFNQESVYLMTSSNKGRTYTCIKVPKEYDLVNTFTVFEI